MGGDIDVVTEEDGNAVRVLLIDNYDSYTFNLFQLFAEVCGAPPDVVKNDDIPEDKWDDVVEKWLTTYHCIVLSPGPGVPSLSSDFGICMKVIRSISRTSHGPTLFGVCLGHQGLAIHFGYELALAPSVAHGILSPVRHGGDGIFREIPYHSWIVREDKESPLNVTARTDDGLVMGVQHESLPLYGVQFHPESICTKFGRKLVENLIHVTVERLGLAPPSLPSRHLNEDISPKTPHPNWKLNAEAINLQLAKEDSINFSERVFTEISWEGSHGTRPPIMWLDSSRVEEGLSRFSIMIRADGPHSHLISYWVSRRTLEDSRKDPREITWCEDFFDYLDREKDKYRLIETRVDLPFDFQCGYVGYLGYEMYYDSLPGFDRKEAQPLPHPDASLVFSDRALVFDHLLEEKDTLWMKETEEKLRECLERYKRSPKCFPRSDFGVSKSQNGPTMSQGHDRYLSHIETCLEEISKGESYELCLTNRVDVDNRVDPLTLHRILRSENPAPYSAFLFYNEQFSVVSCSPEKFLTLDRRGHVTSKPIKGTAKRGETREEDERIREELRNSSKDFSENLMIVDLIRNDLGRVSEIGSVKVPKLMDVESYTTVHQLVTTVTSKTEGDGDCVRLLKAMLPPGSMTGAPKVRSVRILRRLEDHARGIYSGCIGYISCNGACDFSVVIRTAVQCGDKLTIGCGGAIVSLSDPEEEWKEVELKSAALRRGIEKAEGCVPDFHLLETILYRASRDEFFLLSGHLQRLEEAARYFGFPFDESSNDVIKKKLREAVEASDLRDRENQNLRMRLLYGRYGHVTAQTTIIPATGNQKKFRLKFASSPLVDSRDPFISHKTDRRLIYNEAMKRDGGEGVDDVVLYNERGEVTETTIANIAVWSEEGFWLTPPLSSGLLPGVMRSHLLGDESNQMRERVITIDDVKRSTRIKLFNSVRGEFEAQLTSVSGAAVFSFYISLTRPHDTRKTQDTTATTTFAMPRIKKTQEAADEISKKTAPAGKSKKAAKDKSTEGPKRATSAYFFFCNAKREEAKVGTSKVTEVAQKLGQMWKALSPEEQKPYKDLAEEDKERYKKEKEAMTQREE
ncbi:anthranilate synthase, component II [Planoprotostelium fungivorum]|uniref:aminodeoxychorismate synthase n=1 Tax=Planoprotostelium fungivorum TaxID=1890364 RepID=A0A2P6NB36_9EUKA|nr:anthranilate synthase, component II [Planoprotostelium fungivorum]